MGAERYEVVIVNAKTRRQTQRDWNAAELLRGVTWLKRMNAQGGDIYLRPFDGPQLLLVEALNATRTCSRLEQDSATKYSASCTIEP
jgi:hypothetical protein